MPMNGQSIKLRSLRITAINMRITAIGAETRGDGGIDPLTFIPALLVLLFLGDRSPSSKKIFWLAALATIIPLTCESESAPLITTITEVRSIKI
jgi:hypothetical protein